jgi:hypothetical protein
MAIITRWRMPPDSWCGYSSTRWWGMGMPTSCSISMARLRACFLFSPWCSRSDSTIWSPTVNTGFSEVMGSWKIMAMSLPRICRIRDSVACARSSISPSAPRNRMREPSWILPGGVGISRITESEVTDLPLPDSPTIPSVSPGFT